MTEEQIDSLIEERLTGMMKENSVKMCQYMLSVFGKSLIRANAEYAELSQVCTLDGTKYKITAKYEITQTPQP